MNQKLLLVSNDPHLSAVFLSARFFEATGAKTNTMNTRITDYDRPAFPRLQYIDAADALNSGVNSGTDATKAGEQTAEVRRKIQRLRKQLRSDP